VGAARASRVAALALAALVGACGDNGSAPDEPERTQIGGGTFHVQGTVAANENGYPADVATGPFNLVGGGTLEINADWTSAANNIDIVLYVGNCTSAQAVIGACEIANRTANVDTKPEKLTVIGVPSGSYAVGFVNFGPTDETGTFTVFLTR
jgi:hypothetical protein